MTTLTDYQFELLSSVDVAAFGLGLPLACDETGFDPGTRDNRAQDYDNPRGDGGFMGTDSLGAPTWGWALFADSDTPAGALDAQADLGRLWNDPRVRRSPGSTQAIRYRVAGRTRRVFGRGRRWTPGLDNGITRGTMKVACDFKLIDPLHYQDEEQQVTIGMVIESVGGIRWPARFPAASAPPGSQAGVIDVEGDVATQHIIARINGPTNGSIQNPYLVLNGYRIDFTGASLAAGQWIEVDARPWAARIRNQAGAYVPVAPSTRLSKVAFEPGRCDIGFGGNDASASATATVRWRSAYVTL